MKILFFLLFSVLIIIPVYGQEAVNYDLNSTISLNSTNPEESVISKILDNIPGIQFNQNGTVSLNVTINTIVKLQSELDQCELEEQSVDKCQLLSMIYQVLNDQYAQKGTENIFRAMSIAMPVFTGLAGLFLGRLLTDEDRKKRQKKDLEKIRRLINLDFSRIYHFKNSLRQSHENMRRDLQSTKFTNVSVDKNTLTYLMAHLKSGIKFYHWNTLENSGSLIKLEPDEIQRLQFAYDQISGVDENNEEAWLSLAGILESSLDKIPELDIRDKFFEKQINDYFDSIFIGYNTVDDAFKQLDISWLDLNLFLMEYPQEKQKIDEFIESQNVNAPKNNDVPKNDDASQPAGVHP